jgi:hypothetical protein
VWNSRFREFPIAPILCTGIRHFIRRELHRTAGNTFTLKLSAPRESQAPKVSSTSPASNAAGVAPGANITATFPEAMVTNSISTTNFKLSKTGTTTVIEAAVSYDPTTKKATLNPDANLRRGAKYKAVVTTGAKDVAGNQLDQNSSQSGIQQKSWTFTIRNY